MQFNKSIQVMGKRRWGAILNQRNNFNFSNPKASKNHQTIRSSCNNSHGSHRSLPNPPPNTFLSIILICSILVLGPFYPNHKKKERVEYVLIGGGASSISALNAIKSKQPFADILIISNETYFPYQKPPLSKESLDEIDMKQQHQKESLVISLSDFSLDKDTSFDTSIFFQPPETYKKVTTIQEITSPSKRPKLLLNVSVLALDIENNSVTLSNGMKLDFGKVLIATGGNAIAPIFKKPIPKRHQSKILNYHTLNDYLKLKKQLVRMSTDGVRDERQPHVVIIGGGFLGTELSSTLSQSLKVTNVVQDNGIHLENVLPVYLSRHAGRVLTRLGVDVVIADINCLKDNDGKLVLEFENGKVLEPDLVIFAGKLKPNTLLASRSGLEIDAVHGGILVNSELQARTGVYAAGDVASYYEPRGLRRRTEHYYHAWKSGERAGLNMTGEKKAYVNMDYFWSRIGAEVEFEAVGEISSALKTVSVWNGRQRNEHDFDKGIVYYLKEERIVGILMWNLGGKLLKKARKVVSEKRKVAVIDNFKQIMSVYE